MKRLILFIAIAFLTLAVSSQGLLSPIRSPMFNTGNFMLRSAKNSSVAWVPRLNTGVYGFSIGKGIDKPIPLVAVGFGVGVLHYKYMDTNPFNDLGINLMYLKNTETEGSGVGIYITYNITGDYSLLNVGTHYDFFLKQFLFDTGITFHY